MMQVNLFSSQDSLPGSGSLHHNQVLKSPCASLESQISEDLELVHSFHSKTDGSNNNEVDLHKEIFSIAQGNIRACRIFLTVCRLPLCCVLTVCCLIV